MPFIVRLQMWDAPAAEIREEGVESLRAYAEISSSFVVERVFDVVFSPGRLSGFELCERPALMPYVKDYDAIEGNHPADWVRRLDTSNWGVLVARLAGRRVGGAVIAHETAGLCAKGEGDGGEVAVIWDIRVLAAARHRGVGSALFNAVERWALEHRCARIEVETQNINVAACRFYAKHGCTLVAADRFAYPSLPDEVRLIWRKDLGGGAGG